MDDKFAKFHLSINKMRKKPGVKIAIKPINMHGGGYANFLKYIKNFLKII